MDIFKNVLNLAMDRFLKPEDKSLIAWKDENGNPQCMVFRIDIREKITALEKSNLTFQFTIKALRKQIEELTNFDTSK